MRARELMRHPVITCQISDVMSVAAQRMWDHDLGALAVVTDEGTLAGMITDRDICMAALTQFRPLDQMLVHSAMSKHIVVAQPDNTLAEIGELMAQFQVRRIPIVDGQHRPVGIITLNDLVIEAAQPATRMRQGPLKITTTLAAIVKSRRHARAA